MMSKLQDTELPHYQMQVLTHILAYTCNFHKTHMQQNLYKQPLNTAAYSVA